MGEYTQSPNEAMVKRMNGVGAKSATGLATEVGVSQSTLSRWMRESGVAEPALAVEIVNRPMFRDLPPS